MDREAIVLKIKEIIAHVADIEVATISDDATFVNDLKLDSLSLLEIGVDLDYAFKLNVPDEKMQKLRSIPETVQFIQDRRRDLEAEGQVA